MDFWNQKNNTYTYNKSNNIEISAPAHILTCHQLKDDQYWDFPGGLVVKNLPSNAGDAGSILGQGTNIPHCCGATKPAHHN